jgi:hypothetical protein
MYFAVNGTTTITPTTKLYMKYARTPLPGLNPLVFILVDSIDVRDRGQGGYGMVGCSGDWPVKKRAAAWVLPHRLGENKVRFAIVEGRGKGCGRIAFSFLAVGVRFIRHGS